MSGSVSTDPAGRDTRSPRGTCAQSRARSANRTRPLRTPLRSAGADEGCGRRRATSGSGRSQTCYRESRGGTRKAQRRGDARPRALDWLSGRGTGLSRAAPSPSRPRSWSRVPPGHPSAERPAVHLGVRRRLARSPRAYPGTGYTPRDAPLPCSPPRLPLTAAAIPPRSTKHGPSPAPGRAAIQGTRVFLFQTIILLSQRNFITYVQRFVWWWCFVWLVGFVFFPPSPDTKQ